ncbi:MAG: chemotaxis protein CheW [Deltaproteobacteria bacterium]|nr:chemotaxis protein CheW [Deltaproteobacteria bacterium]MBW2695341.1 chemotaxis protein CheW [Deltaproteobacteria bacterium]
MSEAGSASENGDWESLARAASLRGADGEDQVDLLRELLSFRLDESPYAIPVERVREIVRVRKITSVPKMPSWVLGVVALRGEIVQVVDLRMRLGIPSKSTSRQSRIIVLHGDDDRITGMLVDAVDQVLRVNEDAFQNAEVSTESGAVNELCVRDGEFVSIVDVDRVLELRAD